MNCCRVHWLFSLALRVRVAAGLLLVGVIAVTSMADDVVQLTTDGSLKRDPRFIDAGRSLVYCFDERPDLVRMMKLEVATSNVEPMFQDAGNKHHIEPAFSKSGRYLAYTQCTGNLSARLVIRDTQENKEAYITHKGRGGTRSPVFSPVDDRVVYAFAETGPQQLWSVTADGKDKKQITQSQGVSNWPTFTPDGKRIVFSNSRENNYEIYVIDVDGNNEKRLTSNRLMDIRPAVSPDGRQVAFTSTRDGNYEIYIMDIDGSRQQRITHNEERDDYPTWHPDGNRLVIMSERKGRFDLYLVNAERANAVAAK